MSAEISPSSKKIIFLVFLFSIFTLPFVFVTKADAAACGVPAYGGNLYERSEINSCSSGYLGSNAIQSNGCYHWYCDNVQGSNVGESGLCWGCPFDPIINSFSASPASLYASGGSVRLNWTSSRDSSCQLNWGQTVSGPSFGRVSATSGFFQPSDTFYPPHNFGLQCYNSWGNDTAWITVNVGTPPPTTYSLSVLKAGTGTGTVTSSPAGINCGATCNANFSASGSVTLTASPTAGQTFAGWTGACTNATGTCTVSMTSARSVTATFERPPTCTGVTYPSCITPGTHFTVSVNGTANATQVKFPTWSTINGQDDIVWYSDLNSPFSFSIPQASHSGGPINTHVYLYNSGYSNILCGGQEIPLCVTSPFLCTDTPPLNASAYASPDNTGLTADKAYAYSATDTTAKCEFKCNDYYHYDGLFCALNVCQSARPAGTTVFPGDDTALTNNTTNYTYSATEHTSTMCEFHCTDPTDTWDGNTCVPIVSCDCGDTNTRCNGTSYTNPGGASCSSCTGTRYCDFNWKEVSL